MTTAAALPQPHHRASLRLVVGLGMAAVLAGAVTLLHGPALMPPPQMAETPVILPDGSPLYVQKYEVTVAEWNACHDAGACTLRLRTPAGRSDTETPATGLSYTDVGEYLAWVRTATGHPFRLPSAMEWDYMAAPVMPEEPDPIFTDPSLTWASTYLTEGLAPRALKPSGSFSTTEEGIADLDGSVWEWTKDCYAGAGQGITPDRCPAYFVGGEHVAAMAYQTRDPARGGCAVGSPPAHLGMRLVSDRPVRVN